MHLNVKFMNTLIPLQGYRFIGSCSSSREKKGSQAAGGQGSENVSQVAGGSD